MVFVQHNAFHLKIFCIGFFFLESNMHIYVIYIYIYTFFSKHFYTNNKICWNMQYMLLIFSKNAN